MSYIVVKLNSVIGSRNSDVKSEKLMIVECNSDPPKRAAVQVLHCFNFDAAWVCWVWPAMTFLTIIPKMIAKGVVVSITQMELIDRFPNSAVAPAHPMSCQSALETCLNAHRALVLVFHKQGMCIHRGNFSTTFLKNVFHDLEWEAWDYLWSISD